MVLKRLFVATLTLLLMVLTMVSQAQTRLVRGTVTDSKDGSPLAGVTVTAKGTQVATQTNASGLYSLSIPASATTLVFTSVGFGAQELLITGDVVDAALISTQTALENVVVIGYGSARKKDLTGSITQVTSKDFNKGQSTTPEQLIAGKVPGVQITSNGGAPGSGSTIRIRGGASLNASNDPLIVVDGVPLDNGSVAGSANALAAINPNDIESFNILKDASATAIYGSRASNGVIIITTKKGRSGKPRVNFNTLFTVSKLPKYVDVLSADQMRSFVKANGDAAQVARMGNASTNWQDEIYQTGLGSDNNLSVAGSLGKSLPYRLSAGYLTQQGILKTSQMDRKSLGISLSPTLLDNHLKIDINFKGSQSDSRFANQGAIGTAVLFDPTQPVYSGNNNYNGYFEWLDASASTGLNSQAPRNPMGLLMDRKDMGTTLRGIGNIQFDYKFHFLPDLRANLNLGMDKAHGYGTIVVPDNAAQAYRRFKDGSGNLHSGVNNQYSSYRTNSVLEFYLNYLKELNDHRIDLTGGYGYYDFLTKNMNYPDYTFDNVAVSKPDFEFDKPQYTMISYYGRINYGFRNKYLLTAALRTDGSSRFAPEHRWGVFPSAAFAWRIIEEDFMKPVTALSDLKLRIGYGVTGQQDGIPYYDYISYYALANQQAQYQFGNAFYQPYRPGKYYYKRKWEQTATYNIALDYGFLNNRINGSIDFYLKKTSDLLNEIDQPAGSNFGNRVVANIGSMENRGVEWLINTVPVKTADLTWNFNFNATYNVNKITKLTVVDDPNYLGVPVGNVHLNNYVQRHSVGYPRASWFLLQQVYDKTTGKPIENLFEDRNRDGKIDEYDQYWFANPDPKFFFGINSDVTYKKFSAGFAMRANIDNYAYNNIIAGTGTVYNIINPLGYINNGSSDVMNTLFTGLGDKARFSDYYLQNASFLRMDNLFIGYNIGKVLRDKASLRLNASVQNVFVITKYKGLDPEIPGGIDNNFYPRPRVFGLGLNLDF